LWLGEQALPRTDADQTEGDSGASFSFLSHLHLYENLGFICGGRVLRRLVRTDGAA
jgi:hypothetical protein